MTDRGRLIELLRAGKHVAAGICSAQNDCDTCPRTKDDFWCNEGAIADHLIANGVTVQTRGEWITHEDEYLNAEYECSLCGVFQYENTKYCPICGADMRKEKTNDTSN